MNESDPIAMLMDDLRTRGCARLILGRLGQDTEILEVRAVIVAQPDLWGDGEPPHNEELMVTLDTLEDILRWGKEIRRYTP